MYDARVADFLSSLPEEKRKLTEIIRRTVLQADKKVEETIKWGTLTFQEWQKPCFRIHI
jgi:uncharacterized protein YdhG (YjbR/CyaY superfamily)